MSRILSSHLCVLALLGVVNLPPINQAEAASLKRRDDPEPNTIAEYLKGTGKNNMMYSLLQKAPAVLEKLSTCDSGAVQIYAFTDSWYKSTPAPIRAILESDDSLLADVLAYHVVVSEGKVQPNGGLYQTSMEGASYLLNGTLSPIASNTLAPVPGPSGGIPSTMYGGNPTVLPYYNFNGCNGGVSVINGVAIPPSVQSSFPEKLDDVSIADIVLASPQFKTYAKALKSDAALLKVLDACTAGTEAYTLMPFTENGFNNQALRDYWQSEVMTNATLLDEVLRFSVAEPSFTPSALENGEALTTLAQGQTISVSVSGKGIISVQEEYASECKSSVLAPAYVRYGSMACNGNIVAAANPFFSASMEGVRCF